MFEVDSLTLETLGAGQTSLLPLSSGQWLPIAWVNVYVMSIKGHSEDGKGLLLWHAFVWA